MRFPVFPGSTVLLACFLASASAAQQFPAPHAEELKMTANAAPAFEAKTARHPLQAQTLAAPATAPAAAMAAKED
jgi:hypothetical protein